ncbi:serine hydrolase domain-containing protein [Hyphococcus sp.]|uniref:serine hydrolase domain-containing protein n=1 Tax=Hyphococcus sp. TaxID=2038636 RepID=UPI003CCBE5CB
MTEWKTHHKIFTALGAGAAALVVYAGVKADRMARIGAGYKAKIACSEIFVARRDPRAVVNVEFENIDAAMDMVSVQVNQKQHYVRASGPLGLGGVRAVYREGYGCTLANAGGLHPMPEAGAPAAGAAWPEAPPVSGQAIERIDYAALDVALSDALSEIEANHRSLLVAVDGKIVDERYADGFSRTTPFLSWSMAKSVTATLVGAAAMRGLLDVDDPAPVPEWAGDDEKSRITWNDLLRMQSGLAFGEHYDQIRSDVNRMLFERADSGAFAARASVENPPAETWYYSSGTTNLLSRTLRQALEENGLEFHAFAREAIFDPIGASSVIMEPDASGTVIGSSFMYATARDWARLGQLYLQDGVWNEERLLPEGWTEYVRTPALASDGQYGAQFWLNREGADRPRFFPGLPEEMYFFAGHEGQYVFIIPDKRMIVVRTGMTRGRSAMEAVAPLLAEIYNAVGAPEGTEL